MRIILVNPSWTETLGSFAAVGRERVFSPPLALCYLAASVLKSGYEAEIIDAEAEHITADVVANRIKEKRPDIVGINMFSPTMHKTIETAKAIKTLAPEIPIVVGGAHVSIFKQECLEDCFDYAIHGEGDIPIVDLLKFLEGKKNLQDIKGLIYRKDGNAVCNPVQEKIQDVDSLPFPAVQLIRPELYKVRFVNGRRKTYMSVLAMRGCPFQCVFCSEPFIGGRNVRYRSPKNIVDELERNFREFNIRHFTFVDSNITLNRKQTTGICEEIIRRKLPITWEGWTRANLIDEELLTLMKKSGFSRVSFGVESGDPEILKIIKKEVPLEAMRKAFRIARKLKLEVTASVMLGLPGETRESINKTINFVRSIPEIQYSNFSIAIPYPGTELLEMAKKGEHGLKLMSTDYTKWSRYDSSSPMTVNDLSPEDLVKMQKIGLLKMHLSPRRMVASLRLINFSVLFPVFIRLVATSLQDLLASFGSRKKKQSR